LGRTETAEPVVEEVLQGLEREMLAAAENLEFERAAALRDQIARLRQSSTGEGDDADWGGGGRGGKRGRGGRSSKRVPRPKKP
jgi:excinuclease ABC subunit B